jgi:hypothetical protein
MAIVDRAVVCIDELGKMDENDRVAVHEALEQRTAPFSKAGLRTSLRARCSVVAAVNPVWGTHNSNPSPMENAGLSSSLLARFDLLLIVLDSLRIPCEPERDHRRPDGGRAGARVRAAGVLRRAPEEVVFVDVGATSAWAAAFHFRWRHDACHDRAAGPPRAAV